jgi:glycosyltransferase involved in cell wall biosynthesis
MKVLAVTNMYPTPAAPTHGVCVEQLIDSLRSVGLQVRFEHVDRLHNGPSIYYRMGVGIRRAVAEFEPELIHVMYGGVMADQITRQRKLPPVVVTYRGSDLLGENLSGVRRKLISHYGVFCSRRASLKASGVVVVARHLIKRLPKNLPQGKVKVIPSGIDLQRFKPLDRNSCQRQLGWNSNRFHVLFATNGGDPVKRPWLARAAVEQLNADGIPAEFHCLTGVKHQEVPMWINASDAFLLTSLHEGSPSIVREALACEVPVVSVAVGDVAEQLEGIDGCYLASSKAVDLARKLRLVSQRGKRLSCRPRLEGFAHEMLARRHKCFYEAILAPAAGQTMPSAREVPLLSQL